MRPRYLGSGVRILDALRSVAGLLGWRGFRPPSAPRRALRFAPSHHLTLVGENSHQGGIFIMNIALEGCAIFGIILGRVAPYLLNWQKKCRR